MALNQAWTGYSPTLGVAAANVPATAGTLIDGTSHFEKQLSQMMRRPQYRAQRALLRKLVNNDVGAGGNVVENRTRVQAKQALNDLTALGGAVTIETVPLVGATVAGRVTATADRTQLTGMIDEITKPTSYPTDASGNGGGGKLGI